MTRKITGKSMLLISCVMAALLAGWLIFGRETPDAVKNQRTVIVETGTVEDVVTAQGKLEPKDYVDVGLQVSGQIQKLHVNIGDTVKKGQLLVEIDPRIYQSKLAQDTSLLFFYEAQVNEQKAALALARKVQARNQVMLEGKAISKDTFDQGKAVLDGAIAKLESLQAQVDQTHSTLDADRTNLEYTKIYAPMNGTVVTLPVREGVTLNAVQTAPTLMQIANLDVMTNRAQVAEADIMRLSTGMKAYFTTLGDLERRFAGTVRLIKPSPEVINNVVLFDVLIDADNQERRLMYGMNTQVFFVLGKAENVLLLPLEALGRRFAKADNESGKAYYVNVPGQKDPVIIHTGLSDRTHIEIRSGLKKGDVVIVPGRETRAGRSGIVGRAVGPRL